MRPIRTLSVLRTAKPSRVAVSAAATWVNGQWRWLYAAIDVETKLVFDAEVFGRRGTDPAAAILHRLSEKHDLSEAVFLVDGLGYLTDLSRLDLGGRLDRRERNHSDKWFQTLKMRTDRFHTSWVGSLAGSRR